MMDTTKLLFIVVGLLLTFTKYAESQQGSHYIADWIDMVLQKVSSRSGSISDQCLKCICLVESNCKPIGCVMDVGSLSCGYYQIKLPYWTDCGKPGGDWKTCANDYSCATTCVKNYMARYGPKSGCPDTCETYARIHNGGPQGCKNPNTIPYWRKVQSKGC